MLFLPVVASKGGETATLLYNDVRVKFFLP